MNMFIFMSEKTKLHRQIKQYNFKTTYNFK